MKILVTGGAGFIGKNLVRKLLYLGHKVAIFDNLSTGNFTVEDTDITENENVTLLIGPEWSITDNNKILEAFKKVKPQQVYHLAALARIQRSWEHPQETYQVNVTGTTNILDICRQEAIQKVFITSSSSVFAGISLENPNDPQPIKADADQKPLNPYAYHKWLNEKTVEMYRKCWPEMDIIIGRPFNVFGEGQNYHSDYSTVIPKFIEQKKKGESLSVYGDGTQMRDFTYVQDLVDMMISTTKNNSDIKDFNLCNGSPASIKDIATVFNTGYSYVENPRKGEAEWTWGENNTGIKSKVNVLDWIKEVYGR